jgi:hypothetical protein
MKSKVKIPKVKSVSVTKNKPGTTNASSTTVGAKTMSKKGKKAIK